MINKVSTRTLEIKSPLQLHTNFDSTHKTPLRIFGCLSSSIYTHSIESKLNPRVLKGNFIVYKTTKKGYECYDQKNQKNLHYLQEGNS